MVISHLSGFDPRLSVTLDGLQQTGTLVILQTVALLHSRHVFDLQMSTSTVSKLAWPWISSIGLQQLVSGGGSFRFTVLS